IADAQLSPDQVHLILIKSPVLHPDAIPGSGGPETRHAGSTGAARGAAALGAGIALGEVDRAALGSDPVGRTAAYASRVMSFSGTETDCIEVFLVGERQGGDQNWGIISCGLEHLLDLDAFGRIRSL